MTKLRTSLAPALISAESQDATSARPILTVDIEATCADDGSMIAADMEIIEVGATWCTAEGVILDTFERLVRPRIRPTLTAFCKNLTGIGQASVDAAADWLSVSAEFAEFARRMDGDVWGSWGNYDLRQLELECARTGAAWPLGRLEHINLKAAFAKPRRIKQVGLRTALRIVGYAHSGRAHRGLDDARGVAAMVPYCVAILRPSTREIALTKIFRPPEKRAARWPGLAELDH